MKIVIATCGTRGDVQPLIALALALNHRGHNTLIAAPPEHADWVENCGCAFHALGSDFSAMLKGYSQVHTLKPIIGFLGFMRSEILKQLSRLPDIRRDLNNSGIGCNDHMTTKVVTQIISNRRQVHVTAFFI